MSWTNAILELRTLLSDGDTDKERYLKRCIGQVNGTNLNFKTFENRRVTDLVGAVSPYGVYVNGILVTASSEDKELGSFTLTSAPTDGSIVEATYYYKWFNDSELVTFLNKSAEWLGVNELYDNVPIGLKPSALNYAGGLAYQKLAVRWSEDNADVYKMQDGDKGSRSPTNPWDVMAKSYKKDAVALRDAFYTRQGQSLAPLFASISGNVKEVVPKG